MRNRVTLKNRVTTDQTHTRDSQEPKEENTGEKRVSNTEERKQQGQRSIKSKGKQGLKLAVNAQLSVYLRSQGTKCCKSKTQGGRLD